MIFYFTGTGNSLYAAKCISKKLNDRLISIAQCMKDKKYTFECDKNENIGFVYPVYGWRPPKIVLDFIKKMIIKNKPNKYVYSVFTYGGTEEATAEVMAAALKRKNITLSGSYKILMPTNNILISKNIITNEENTRRINDEEKECSIISKNIINKTQNYSKKHLSLIKSHLIGGCLFKLWPKVIKFYVQDSCRGCGLCIKSCPKGALKKENDKIVRDSSKCLMCMKCINCCPSEAIQFGEKTVSKKRYKHPQYKMTEI